MKPPEGVLSLFGGSSFFIVNVKIITCQTGKLSRDGWGFRGKERVKAMGKKILEKIPTPIFLIIFILIMIEPAQGDRAWRIERVDPTGYGMYNSIALDSSDRPHISYGDNNTETLKSAYQGPIGLVHPGCGINSRERGM